jgi:uncharacterized protein YjbI with pentapeptide repeats
LTHSQRSQISHAGGWKGDEGLPLATGDPLLFLDLASQLAGLNGTMQRNHQGDQSDGFLEKIVRTLFHRFDGEALVNLSGRIPNRSFLRSLSFPCDKEDKEVHLMANQDQLTLLTQNGVAAWNQWRQGHPEIEIDLSEADLCNFNLSGVNFSGADLSGADLSGAKLDNTDFTGAITNRCIGYPQVTNTLVLDDPLLTSAFATEKIGLTEIGTLDTNP